MSSHLRRLAILLLVALPGLWGCAAATGFLPSAVQPAASIAAVGGTKAVQASREITDSEEYYVGRAVASRILSTYPLYRNPAVTEYVNEVGQTVARKSPRPNTYKGYHFAVLDSEEINAFACPGGTIFITRGLLATCASEDELAAVLAHEVTHVVDKDGINSISKARWTEVWTSMGAEAARQYGGVAGNLVNLFEGSIDDVFKSLVVNGYSRDAEFAADAGSVKISIAAGYDPGALARVLAKIQAKEKPGAGGFYKTHPPASERLAKVKGAAREGAPAAAEVNRTKRFQKIVKV
ncbi:MAG: M48 family metalloprotease [Desulfobaccales bacterium]